MINKYFEYILNYILDLW